MLDLLSGVLLTIAPTRPVVDPTVEQGTVNNGGDSIISEDSDNSNIVPIIDLPAVAPTSSVVDTTADNPTDNTNNIVDNNDNNIVSDDSIPTTVDDDQQIVGNESQPVPATTTTQRERRPPRYLLDYVCDRIAMTQEVGATGLQASNSESSRQLEFADTH